MARYPFEGGPGDKEFWQHISQFAHFHLSLLPYFSDSFLELFHRQLCFVEEEKINFFDFVEDTMVNLTEFVFGKLKQVEDGLLERTEGDVRVVLEVCVEK